MHDEALLLDAVESPQDRNNLLELMCASVHWALELASDLPLPLSAYTPEMSAMNSGEVLVHHP